MNKFQDKATQCKLVVYTDGYRGFRHYDHISQCIKISRNVISNEHNFHIPIEIPKAMACYDPWLGASLIGKDTLEFSSSNEDMSSFPLQNDTVGSILKVEVDGSSS